MSRRKGISRREFLRSGGLTVAGLALASCGAAPATPEAAAPTVAPATVEAAVPTTAEVAGATAAPTEVAAPTAAPTTAPAASGTMDKVVIWSPGDNGTVADWATDPILQAVKEATNADIEIVKIGWDVYQDQVNAAIASGQAPDIIGAIDHNRRTIIGQWVRDGVVAPYDGELGPLSPNVLAAYQTNPALAELKIDGKIYMDPVEWGGGLYPNMGLLHVRKDLLDKYGLQPPDTFDQYLDYLRAAKADGSTGVIFGAKEGLGPAINAFAGAYGAPMLGWVKGQNGYEYWAIQPGIKDALLLFRKMVGQGLVDPVVWESLPGDARDTYVAGQGAALIFNGGGHIGRLQNDMDLAGKGHKEWLLPALDAGAGSRGYTSEPQFWAGTFISALQGNNQTAAARVINYLNSEEGYKLCALGLEGRDYEESNGEITLLPERTKRGFPVEAGGTGAHPIATAITSWVPQEWQDWALLYGKDQTYQDWYKAQWENQGKHQIESVGLLSSTPLWTDFQSTSTDLVNRSFLQIVQSKSDAEAGTLFDQFVQDWKSSGGDTAQAEMSTLLSKIYT